MKNAQTSLWELALKYICRLINLLYPPKHGLIVLWDKILERFNEFGFVQDELDDIKIFISVLEELDCDGSHFRYSEDNKGEVYNKKPQFINVKNIQKY